MAHFAFVDKENIVRYVAVIPNDQIIDIDGEESEELGALYCVEAFPMIDSSSGRWMQASYNARIRGAYPACGYSYFPEEDIFVEPQRFSKWIRNGSSWNPPIEQPTYSAPGWPEGSSGGWVWDDVSGEWTAREYPFVFDETENRFIPRDSETKVPTSDDGYVDLTIVKGG